MKFNNQIIKGILILLFVVFGTVQTKAQASFKPGLRGGANFSHFTKGNVYDYYYDENGNEISDRLTQYSSKTDFYIGFYGALKLSKYYTMQPEINYSGQGSNFKSYNRPSRNLNVDYLSLGLMNKFTFANFNLHVGPTLDFLVNKDFNTETNFDMAFVLGLGFNFTPNFGIEARVKKGIIPVVDFSDDNHTNVVFSVGGTYTFDIK